MARAKPIPAVRFHICEPGEKSQTWIGPGKIALLEAIERTGSITAAAKELGMSYRRAWLLVEETNRCLVEPAVATATGGSHGGGTSLTPTGVELCAKYRALEQSSGGAVADQLGAILRNAPPRKSVR